MEPGTIEVKPGTMESEGGGGGRGDVVIPIFLFFYSRGLFW